MVRTKKTKSGKLVVIGKVPANVSLSVVVKYFCYKSRKLKFCGERVSTVDRTASKYITYKNEYYKLIDMGWTGLGSKLRMEFDKVDKSFINTTEPISMYKYCIEYPNGSYFYKDFDEAINAKKDKKAVVREL